MQVHRLAEVRRVDPRPLNVDGINPKSKGKTAPSVKILLNLKQFNFLGGINQAYKLSLCPIQISLKG